MEKYITAVGLSLFALAGAHALMILLAVEAQTDSKQKNQFFI
jgi:hypothetical protein